jgi:alpha-1,6-mannosyltransferase
MTLLLPVTPTSTESRIKRTRLALYLLTLATTIFRSELALLLGSQCLYMLIRTGSNIASAISLTRRVFIPAILTAVVAGLVLTVSIDTYFWQSRKLLWPELAAFLSNVFPKDDGLGASAWGTSPWHWYFTSALPRLVMNPFLLLMIPGSLLTPALRTSNLDLVIPSLGYVCLYSILPHKETRFLFPIIPPLTASIARTADYIYQRSDRYALCHLVNVFLVLSTAGAAIISHGFLLPLSAQTYAGAHALSSLHTISLNYPPQPTVRVHLTNLALQTGVTRFLSTPSFTKSNSSLVGWGHDRPVLYLPGSADGSRPALSSSRRTKWTYDKSDNEADFLRPAFWAQFDYVVVEEPARVIGRWDVVDKVPTPGRPTVLKPDVGRGLLVLGSKQDRREDDGLSRLLEAMYGQNAKVIYGVLHDLLREGYGTEKVLGRRVSLTTGWWVHWGLEMKLYIMKRAEGAILP